MPRNVSILLATLVAASLAASGAAISVPTHQVTQAPATRRASIDLMTIPGLLSYQGKLTDSMGIPVPDSAWPVRFALYTEPVGGTPFWTENQPVETSDGLFHVLLGSGTPIPSVPELGDLFLGMKVGDDPEMEPRLHIVSAAYAFLAGKADSANYAAEARPFGPAGGDLSGDYPDPSIADDAVTMAKIEQAGAAPGQVIKWTGSDWAPRNDSIGTGGGDNAWTRVGSDSVLYTIHRLGIARGEADNMLYGANRFTHVNLGVACTTGTSGQNFTCATVSGGYTNDATNSYATVGGGYNNDATGYQATVGGGYTNYATGNHATVGGGRENTATGGAATVGGGFGNAATDTYTTVGGGYSNAADTSFATVGGGYNNTASGTRAFVGGGSANTASATHAFVGGGSENTASGVHAFVAGGLRDTASGPYATVGGGRDNAASDTGAFVGGGMDNTADRYFAAVGGGQSNTASDTGTFVGGGTENTASDEYATVAGGARNAASAWYATVAGGRDNTASLGYAAVAGGYGNTASGNNGFVGGGEDNTASGIRSTVAGGAGNVASLGHAAVGGGQSNTASGEDAVVAGGWKNTASAWYATVAGGENNTASDTGSFVGGGEENTASAWFAAVGGGYSNDASDYCAFVGGGYNNTASAPYATVDGGERNQVDEDYGTIPGGYGDTCSAGYALAAGYRTRIRAGGLHTFAFGESCTTSVTRAVVFYHSGAATKLGVGVQTPTHNIDVQGGAYCNGTNWVNGSSRKLKTDITTLTPEQLQAVLKELDRTEVVNYRYKSETGGEKHIGLIAEDAPELLATPERDGINTADAIGFLFAALKAQQQQNEELSRKVTRLESALARVEAK